MRYALHGLVLASALFAASCVSVLPDAAPPKPRFHIVAADADSLSGEPLPFSLVIDEPRATRVYDSVRIAVASAPGRIEYLAGAEWADRAPRLFQTALIQTFEDAGRILAVGDRSSLPIADFVLQTDIRRMELAVQGGHAADISVYARLTNGKGVIYAAKKFEASISSSSTKPDAVYAAFNTGFDQIVTEMVAWSYAEGERANSRK
ncbi:MAG: ABC transporter [Hyphococcus sp.]|nr:MAG: ABC transporter [Marinicaulis sp.]